LPRCSLAVRSIKSTDDIALHFCNDFQWYALLSPSQVSELLFFRRLVCHVLTLLALDAFTRLKRGFKALFKGSRSKRNSNATTTTKSKRQIQAIKFRGSDTSPLVNPDDTLVQDHTLFQDDTLVQASHVSDPGLQVVGSSPAVTAPQIPLQQRHSTALIFNEYPDPGRGSPVSEMSRRTFPATSAPSPIDTAATNTITEHRLHAANATMERHEVAATPIVALEMSLPERVQTSAGEGESESTHEIWRSGEDETLFVGDATLHEVGQHTLRSVPEKESVVETQRSVTVTASQPVENSAAKETTVVMPENIPKPTMNPDIEEKEINEQAAHLAREAISGALPPMIATSGPLQNSDVEEKEINEQAVRLAREASSGAFPPMLATSGPLQDFYHVDTDQNKERYPGRMAC